MSDFDIFASAKAVGLRHIRDWLPDGRDQGGEWIALNPTRQDEHYGSFRINLTTGKWADFQDASGEASGNDVISLYAYLNSSQIDNAMHGKKYKNEYGGRMYEAANLILLEYDHNYFPDDKIDFNITYNDKKDFWDGWRQCQKGIENPPELKTDWFQKNTDWGIETDRWFFDVDKNRVMTVVRFKQDVGKKEKADKPFTIWTDGKDNRWRCKGLKDKKYPLYNYNDIVERQNHPVILCEGQKKPAMLDKIIHNEYVCTGWYGGAGNTHLTDFEPLCGREIWFVFDADNAGRKALKKIKEIAKDLDIVLHIVYPPLKVKKGWNLDDAIDDEKWDKNKILTYIKENADRQEQPEQQEPSVYLDDKDAFKFKILGYCGDNIAFFPWGRKQVVFKPATSVNKSLLMTLMDRNEWGDFYRKEDGGIAWDSAINDILRKAEDLPIFDYSRVRRTGAWIDNGEVIINTGEYLLIDGQRQELYERNGQYIYEKAKFLPYATENPLLVNESSKLIDILQNILWEEKSFPYLLAGWLLLAPFGGAFRWRPYIWLTGKTGSGKSWILEHITRPLTTYWFGLCGKGTSHPAGYRQGLDNSTICIEVDEMDPSTDKKSMENIEQTLTIFREGSSGAEYNAVTYHGTADGTGRQWIIQAMVMFASIGSRMSNSADKNRFTVITLADEKDIDERQKRFEELQEKIKIITPLWAKAFHSRTYKIINELLLCIKIMINQATDILGNKRAGDQIGTLFAGAWMVNHDVCPNASEARTYLEEMEIDKLYQRGQEKGDEELVLDEILTYRIDLNDGEQRTRVSIGMALKYWFVAKTNMIFVESIDDVRFPGADLQNIKRELEQYGIKPQISNGKPVLQIAIGHPGIYKILKDTTWYRIYADMLSRLPYCEKGIKGPSDFAGVPKRFKQLNAEDIFNSPPF